MLVEDFERPEFDRIIFTHIPKAFGSTFREMMRNQIGKLESLTPYTAEAREAFERRIKEESLSGVRFFSGHYPYGIHEEFGGKSLYLSLVREPVERILSWYNFLQENPSNRLHKVKGHRESAMLLSFQ
jgi:hypothetical protein